jgi:hypothetical protein
VRTLIVLLLFVITGVLGYMVYDHGMAKKRAADAVAPGTAQVLAVTTVRSEPGPVAPKETRPFDWEHAPADSTQLVMLLAAAAAGDPQHAPRVGVVYPATGLQIIQKVPGGYVATLLDPSGALGPHGPVYLETDEPLARDQIVGGRVRYVGLYRYTALDGFERTIFHFQLRRRTN